MEMTLHNVKDIVLTNKNGEYSNWIDVSIITSEGQEINMSCFHKKDNPINIKMKPTIDGDKHV